MTRNRHTRSAKIRTAAAVGVLAVTGAVVATNAGADAGPDYRLATATTGDTVQVLEEVGVIEPVSQASVAFPTDGTVATVEVAAGDTVAVGDVLATLDPTSLVRALHDAQSTLAQAELRLERALDGEDVGSTGGAPTGSVSAMSTGDEVVVIELASATQAGDEAPVVDEELRAAQEAVLAAQQQVDADLAAADEALADAEALCTFSDESSSDPGTTDDTAALEACRDALTAVLDAQQTVAASQQALADAATALDDLRAERAAATPPSTTPSTTPPLPSGTGNTPSTDTTPSGSTPNGSAPSGSTTGATSSSPSSADLIAYQADVDAAAAAVTVAEQAITQGTIVSVIAGTVVSVGIEPGDVVTAASAEQAIVVAGDGGYEVTTTVSVADLPDLEVGQAVTVQPDGRGSTVEGEIVAIGVAATDGSTSYSVTIGLTEPTNDDLRNGGIASVAITVTGAEQVLVVPTTAVTLDGDRATVLVHDGSATETVNVEIGAIGSTWTEIRSGLEAGQQVVLADLAEPLPGSATEASSSDTGEFQGGPPAGFNLRPGG